MKYYKNKSYETIGVNIRKHYVLEDLIWPILCLGYVGNSYVYQRKKKSNISFFFNEIGNSKAIKERKKGQEQLPDEKKIA